MDLPTLSAPSLNRAAWAWRGRHGSAHVFDTGHVTGVEYSNVVKPGQVPMGGMGAIPVIARLVCADGAEEWWPARAVRWTKDAVLVGYESSPGDQKSLRHLRLGIDDVAREIRPPVTRDP